MSEEEFLLGHILFTSVGLNKDSGPRCLLGRTLVLGWAQGPVNLLFWAGLQQVQSLLTPKTDRCLDLMIKNYHQEHMLQGKTLTVHTILWNNFFLYSGRNFLRKGGCNTPVFKKFISAIFVKSHNR